MAQPSVVDDDEFRPDIEGLRAVAVVVVVLFHARVARFSGGFVGVDVFFVLSGFLITRLLLREVARTGTISLRHFWARRARRLLPASCVVVVVTVIAAQVLLAPIAQRPLATDSLAAGGFAINFVFASRLGDYFASQLGQTPSPLLHFWSLAVEEQFYFVWPIAMVVLTRLRTAAMRNWAVALLAASAALSLLLASGAPTQPRIYLGTDTRASQLIAGAVLAMIVSHHRGARAWLTKVAPVGLPASLLLIVAAVLSVHVAGLKRFIPVYSHGCLALFGVLVAATVGFLMFAPANPITRALSTRPLVAIGRYSYAIYLWHVLVINLFSANNVFGWHVVEIRNVGIRTAVVVAVTIAIAALSMRFVEAPLQRRLFPWANQAAKPHADIETVGAHA